jgi:hypothetical protein
MTARWDVGAGLSALAVMLSSCLGGRAAPAAEEAGVLPQAQLVASAASGLRTSTPRNAASTLAPPTTIPTSSTPTPHGGGAITHQVQLSSSRPWLLLPSADGLWAAYEDGSGLTQLLKTSEAQYAPPPFAISPDAKALAFALIPDFGLDSENSNDYSLGLLSLPGLEETHLSTLFAQAQISAVATEFPQSDQGTFEGTSLYQRLQIGAAMFQPHSIAWSPSGAEIAFVAALDGLSTDVYTYDTATGAIVRLTSGLAQATDLHWSPDGRFVIHKAVADINIGRNGMDVVDGLWIAAADGSANRLAMQGPAEFLRWLGPDSFLAYFDEMGCGYYDLSLIRLPSGERQRLWKGQFEDADADPKSGSILVALTNLDERGAFDECSLPKEEGLFIIRPPSFASNRIGSVAGDGWVRQIDWQEASSLFVVQTDSPVMEVSTAGAISEISKVGLSSHPSPSGRWSWAYSHGLGVLGSQGQTARVFDGRICAAFWHGQADVLYFLSDEDSPILYAASPPSFTPVEVIRGLALSCLNPPQWLQVASG